MDKENRYANFRLACLPYPGCEFFKLYRDNCYSTSSLFYDWSESHNDAKINVPDLYPQTTTSPIASTSTMRRTTTPPYTANSSFASVNTTNDGSSCGSNSSNNTKKDKLPRNHHFLSIDWDNYQSWDLKDITLNYMKAALAYLQDSNSGLLVHCISGWDRTPLFISLLRISLWADGLIHQTLTAIQLLYLTVSYE